MNYVKEITLLCGVGNAALHSIINIRGYSNMARWQPLFGYGYMVGAALGCINISRAMGGYFCVMEKA
ncbi:hypothetical protein M977_00193 [Buttiauxella gaviniae ATCC 51604]|uniref:Uncharacterized protein n=1 Tax=Buttiauxella gaviniae ATCC 51604 TaxID=1354253 RepID=A0A1B7I632_9ENTR|nr:hypothetical protein M977_00193 [Buttiauxella gaviniae ATCC 51604]